MSGSHYAPEPTRYDLPAVARSTANTANAVNGAEGYGVTVDRAAPGPQGYVWRAVSVQHVPPGQNGGNHHIYLNIYDEQGGEARGNTNVQVVWGWNGQGANEVADPKPLEKPRGEYMTNIPMERGQVVWCKVQGYGYPSDTVRGLHTAHPDEGDDVRTGHHSFIVQFRLMREMGQPQQPPMPDEETQAVARRLREIAIDLNHLASALDASGEAKG